MKKKIIVNLFAVMLGVCLGGTAIAQVQASSSGEVRRIDADKGKIAIKHGAIADFELPAMTLIYNISPALLKAVKPGDKVDFTAKHQNNTYTIETITVDN